LDFERFDLVRDFISPAGDEISTNDMFSVKHGTLGFGTNCVRPKVVAQILFSKGIEVDTHVAAFLIDAGVQVESVCFPPRIPLLRKVPH
jgi:hypothetical protein